MNFLLNASISFGEVSLKLLTGFGTSCLLFFASFFTALVLGLLLCLGSVCHNKVLNAVLKGIIAVIRGTPLILQIIVVYYVPGIFFDYPFRSRFIAVYIAFALHFSCYFSEIYRGGLESVSKSQWDAGFALGMTKSQTFFHIILPQVIKIILPPLANETMNLVKDTSLASTIGVVELFSYSKQLVNKFVILWPLFYAGAFYFVFNWLIGFLFKLAEKKLKYYTV